jgi:hypothetical protein
MGVLLYLLYGQNERYHRELTYSVASARHHLGTAAGGVRIVYASDRENARPDLGVESVILTSGQLYAWQEHGAYNHALKPNAVRHFLDVFDAPVVWVDTDTIFRSSPKALFDRIGPGRTLMHASEGKLRDIARGLSYFDDILQAHGGRYGAYTVTADSEMCNSGVFGLHPQDRGLIDDAVALMQDMRSVKQVFSSEQLATAVVFARRSVLSFADDVVDHYFGSPRRYLAYQIGRLYPTRSVDAFNRLADHLPPLAKELPVALRPRLVARLRRALRGISITEAYAFALYLEALYGRRDSERASAYADAAMNILLFADPRPDRASVRKMFTAFLPDAIDRQTWLDAGVAARWRAYWDGMSAEDLFK